ncbi:MAG TPA: DNA polymerase III subunit gamma/tau [Alphaproteobacteria bacterium]|nr:DNA polymerase III subunit gamma/tau [Alphaproteobacteria bacterium]
MAMDDPDFPALLTESPPPAQEYRVLARKYRPRRFADLIGQEAMVRTLGNAIASGRLAHAYILTGVRGVGKTTTARILARCLNYTTPDGVSAPTIDPSQEGLHCAAIAESRHVDVLEMDAASRTGIDDIREIIESVRYRPASARYKIYIIDEVHMLSKAAFNGLLKTLEEPPPHVIFIFATTEIRKVPLTILSRCQRFDLRRVGQEELCAHLARIAEQEGAALSTDALRLIARAAEGSVRDALSLLDQAIAHGGGEGNGEVDEAQVRNMLGLADRGRVFDLLEFVLRGAMPQALDELRAQYEDGADPAAVLQDMLELVHWLTRIRLAPQAAEDLGWPEALRQRAGVMAEQLSVPALTRAWQLLLKGLGETREAQHSLAAGEMALVRLGFAADLPTPADIIQQLQPSPAAHAPAARLAPAPPRPRGGGGAPAAAVRDAVAEPAARPETRPMTRTMTRPPPQSLSEVVQLAAQNRDIKLQTALTRDVHLVHFEAGRIEFRPGPHASPQLAAQLGEKLALWTGRRWIVSLSNSEGAPSLDEQEKALAAQRFQEAGRDPLVQEALRMFPGAEIVSVQPGAADPAHPSALGRSFPDRPDPTPH